MPLLESEGWPYRNEESEKARLAVAVAKARRALGICDPDEAVATDFELLIEAVEEYLQR